MGIGVPVVSVGEYRYSLDQTRPMTKSNMISSPAPVSAVSQFGSDMKTKILILALGALLSFSALAMSEPRFIASLIHEKGTTSNGKTYELFVEVADKENRRISRLELYIDDVKMKVPLGAIKSLEKVWLKGIELSHQIASIEGVGNNGNNNEFEEVMLGPGKIVFLTIPFGPYELCEGSHDGVSIMRFGFRPDGALESSESYEPCE